MMFRATDMVMIGLMVAAAAFTYKTKHEAENQFDLLAKTESQIRYEEDTISILKADWSLLTQPARLQRLTETYATELDLLPVEPQQIVTLDAIPQRPPEVPDPNIDSIAEMLKRIDKTSTGAIKP
ncbi:cell division protein FtsL [Tianweitania aestuarii]